MPSPPSGSHGTRAGRRLHGAGLLRGATGQEAWAGEAGAGIRSPGRQGPTHGWRPDPLRRQQLGAGTTERGWSSTWPQKHWLGPACLSTYLQLIAESLGPGVRPGEEAAENGGIGMTSPSQAASVNLTRVIRAEREYAAERRRSSQQTGP